ncbi:hypothetical protein GCM10011351_17390 [Paraliobacillus quinghaiensis]|uniref:Uncharacterized protein n=1 Tax=Paraliobacillus quinghaiensis TaxID=470815 RepID=A0A917TPB1_9BACI|nr:hypothetical protein GCM10011351_17390 [Paraliobacillus quinghaiensis]
MLYFIGYLLLAAIISGIVTIIFPPAGAIIGIILLIGVFGAAWNKTKERLDILDAKAYEKKLNKKLSDDE